MRWKKMGPGRMELGGGTERTAIAARRADESLARESITRLK
jgi:hypothetical protein